MRLETAQRLARMLARGYVAWLDKDGGVWTKSHLIMIEHCKIMEALPHDVLGYYHDYVLAILEGEASRE